MANVRDGELAIVTATHNGSAAHIIFGDGATTFSTYNDDGVRLVGNADIHVYNEATSHSSAPLRFVFMERELEVGDASNGDVHFATTGAGANIE